MHCLIAKCSVMFSLFYLKSNLNIFHSYLKKTYSSIRCSVLHFGSLAFSLFLNFRDAYGFRGLWKCLLWWMTYRLKCLVCMYKEYSIHVLCDTL